jgi:hypothetical protein
VFARQPLYDLSHTSGLFALGIFQIGSQIYAQTGLNHHLLFTLPVNRHHHTQLIGSDGGLSNFLPRLAMNHHSPNLHLPSSWNYKHEPPSLGPYLYFF